MQPPSMVIPDERMQRVIEVKELMYSFDDNGPTVRVQVAPKLWAHNEKVDPCPGYGHDLLRVVMQLQKCEELFPVPIPPKVFLLQHEVIGRTNGSTGFDNDYNTKDAHDRSIQHPFIVLSGKRIPMMPAMTRYLVAHEYGHVVDTVLANQRYTDKNPDYKQDDEYRKLRGLEKQSGYGPGTWHKTVGEVFANDFRVFVCGVEPEFWPHDVPPPQEVPAVADWWKARLYEVAEARDRARKAEIVRAEGQAIAPLAIAGTPTPT